MNNKTMNNKTKIKTLKPVKDSTILLELKELLEDKEVYRP